MKNKVILCALAIILVGILSGCTESSTTVTEKTENIIIGKWLPIEGESYLYLPYADPDYIGRLMFYPDYSGYIGAYVITWEAQDEYIIVHLYSGRETMTFSYSYDESTEQLTLTDQDNNTYKFRR